MFALVTGTRWLAWFRRLLSRSGQLAGSRLSRARAGRAAVATLALAALAAGGVAFAEQFQIGRIGPSLGITANGRALHPVGRQTTVGNFPTGSALTPDGRFLWVADCGHDSNDVRVLDVASGAVVQTLPLPGCYGGVAIAPDGLHAYVGGTPRGSSPTEGPTQGDKGDVVHIFSVDLSTGHGSEQAPLQLAGACGKRSEEEGRDDGRQRPRPYQASHRRAVDGLR